MRMHRRCPPRHRTNHGPLPLCPGERRRLEIPRTFMLERGVHPRLLIQVPPLSLERNQQRHCQHPPWPLNRGSRKTPSCPPVRLADHDLHLISLVPNLPLKQEQHQQQEQEITLLSHHQPQMLLLRLLPLPRPPLMKRMTPSQSGKNLTISRRSAWRLRHTKHSKSRWRTAGAILQLQRNQRGEAPWAVEEVEEVGSLLLQVQVVAAAATGSTSAQPPQRVRIKARRNLSARSTRTW
mmetsp:Transcript_28363/g.60441  ORF Transcript_28363/g.60441 Transcript_28363/m.60441 type:complete len:237 (-) Transcript_28363:968-1678(-)